MQKTKLLTLDVIVAHPTNSGSIEGAIWAVSQLDESHKDKREQLFVSILAKMAKNDPAQARDRFYKLSYTYKFSLESAFEASSLINAEEAVRAGPEQTWKSMTAIVTGTPLCDRLCQLVSKLAIIVAESACK